MKKYIVFAVSFVSLYMIVQILSGLVLTAFYTPDLSSLDSHLSQEVAFGKVLGMPLLVTLFIASLAYFFSQKLFQSSTYGK